MSINLIFESNTLEAYPRKLPYPGAFNPNVEKKIKEIIGQKYCIHLFSGSSTIGHVRVDFDHPHATRNQNVYDFCQEFRTPRQFQSILLLDPNYSISRKNLKLKPHGIKENLSGNVLAHQILNKFIQDNDFNEILLLDYCSPKFDGYHENWFWRVKTGGWQNNRTLTWYKREEIAGLVEPQTTLVESQTPEQTERKAL